MPLIGLLVTACVWVAAGTPPPEPVAPFLALAFANGCVLEIGRKIWAPEEEREGVETYSRLWGPQRATGAWLIVLGTAGAFTALSLSALSSRPLEPTVETSLVVGLGAALLLAAAAGYWFLRKPTRDRRKWLSASAAIWVLTSYLILVIAAGFAMPWA